MAATVWMRYALKVALRPLLFRYPPVGLQPERLYVWFRALTETLEVPGAILEVGCAAGGTAAVSSRLVSRIGPRRRYVCVDTFGGFVDSQFDVDGGDSRSLRHRKRFSANSISLVRRTLDGLGARDVELVQGDIVGLPAHMLPPTISAALVDVDLAEPVRAALEKIYPLLAPGGVIVVDDCPEGYDWTAREGYLAFVQEHGLPTRFSYGAGIVAKPAQ